MVLIMTKTSQRDFHNPEKFLTDSVHKTRKLFVIQLCMRKPSSHLVFVTRYSLPQQVAVNCITVSNQIQSKVLTQLLRKEVVPLAVLIFPHVCYTAAVAIHAIPLLLLYMLYRCCCYTIYRAVAIDIHAIPLRLRLQLLCILYRCCCCYTRYTAAPPIHATQLMLLYMLHSCCCYTCFLHSCCLAAHIIALSVAHHLRILQPINCNI